LEHLNSQQEKHREEMKKHREEFTAALASQGANFKAALEELKQSRPNSPFEKVQGKFIIFHFAVLFSFT
jgi:chaperonin cofactor prefoldin